MSRPMLRRGVSLTAAVLATAALMAAPAWADGVPGGQTTTTESTSHSGNQYAPRVVVTVTTDGVRETTTASAPLTSQTHPPCWMVPSWTGAEYAEYYDSGQANRDARHMGEPSPDPIDGYEQHSAEGTEAGQYWSPICSSEYWDGDIQSFFDYVDQFFAAHPTQWVPAAAGDPNASIDIPPEILMHVALRNLDLSQGPGIEINPDGNSVVNLPTWVWATDATFVEHRVRAQFNDNWAEVIATPVRLVLSTNGPAEINGDCAGGGTIYRPGATTNCSVTFRRSTVAQGAWSISASIAWRVHWEGSGGQNEALPPPDSPGVTTIQVPVDEVQTVLENNPTPGD